MLVENEEGSPRALIASLDIAAGEAVRAARKRRGRTQRELALAVSELLPPKESWGQTTVAKIEAGTRPLRWAEVWAVCHVLGIADPRALLSRDAHQLVIQAQRQSAEELAEMHPGWEWLSQDRREQEIRTARRRTLAMGVLQEIQRGEQGPWTSQELERWQQAFNLLIGDDSRSILVTDRDEHGEHPETP